MKQISSSDYKIRIIFLITVITSLFLNPKTVSASCVAPGTPEEELKSEDAVFTGSVVYISSANGIWINEVTKVLLSMGFSLGDFYEQLQFGRRIVFEVDRSWKGITTSSVMIRTGYSKGNSSGYPFELGGYYLVYASHAYGDPNKYLLTSLCSSTKESPNNSEDIAYLNTQPTLELRYFPALIRTINISSLITFLSLGGFIYLLLRKRKSNNLTK